MATDLTTIRLLMAIADSGSFNRAASIVGIKESTVSRRMSELEQAAGIPLFLKRTTGTELTEAGRQVVAAAESVMEAVVKFDDAVSGVGRAVQRPVTISAPEGLSSYILAPLSSGFAPPTCPVRFSDALPPVSFLPLGTPADIEVILVQPGAPIPKTSDYVSRKLGLMQFRPAASRGYLEANGAPQTVADLARRPILQHSAYTILPSFARWADIAATGANGPVVTVSTSSALHRVTLTGAGISLLPTFSELLDPSVVVLPVGEPLGVEVWAVALPETLSLPTAKRAWEVLSHGFHSSVWFNAG
ncbi:LysR family transcriptional regulator [Azospirillum canadense]|uniref:LysR family transcriptional regulator n=1 Tax=Azospirillum canadense TaxID=403962 RepID=UPI0022264145|nr:LysR family transcriptional regulator [Azospirillum canadense]MCW2240389.1 DNA-binding transcriptional LysR family regulator [Azospirillum canadense]